METVGASSDGLFAAEDLLSALELYGDLPLDLILDGSADLEFAPLDCSPPTQSSYPASVSSSDSSSSEDSSSSHRMTASQQQKVQRSFLQDQIAYLERELAIAKAKRPSTKPPVWRELAKRQRARRTAAESENERLRTRLLRLIQVAQSLQVVLLQRGQPMAGPSFPPRPKESDAWMDDLGQVLQRFAADIQRAYEVIDTVLPVDGLAIPTGDEPITRSVVKSHIADDGVEHLYVETKQAFVVPFPFHRVAGVAWQALTTHFERQQRQLELYCCTDSLFSCKFFGGQAPGQLKPDGEENRAAVTKVARAFQLSETRIAVIFRGFIAPLHATVREAVAVSTGWMAFQPMDGDAEYSVAQVCIRTVPRRSDLLSLAHQKLVRLPTYSADLGTFVSQNLCTTAEDIMAVVEEVENILMDEMTTTTDHETP